MSAQPIDALFATVRHLPRHARIVAFTLSAILLLVVLLIGGNLLGWYAASNERLQDIEPRYARVLGFMHSVDDLEGASDEAARQLAGLAYLDTDGAATGASVQQQLRSLFESAGMSISGSQLLTPRQREGFSEIGVNLTATGPMEGLERVLLELQTARPMIFVRSVDLSPVRVRRGEEVQDIALSLSVSVVRLQ